MPERPGDRGLLEAAVNLAQRSVGLDDHGARRAGFELELHADHAARGSIEPVDHEPASGFVYQRHERDHDPTA